MNKVTQNKEVMTPDNARWDEFVVRLEGPEGCNFHKDDEGDTLWTCKAKIERPLARKLLEKMGMDIEESLNYFNDHGGYCDCEILFNVR